MHWYNRVAKSNQKAALTSPDADGIFPVADLDSPTVADIEDVSH